METADEQATATGTRTLRCGRGPLTPKGKVAELRSGFEALMRTIPIPSDVRKTSTCGRRREL